jgi:hypothetical protein
VQRASGIPRALCFKARDYWHNSGASRREGESVSNRHCEEQSDEAIQLSLSMSSHKKLDCFASLAMTI